MNSGHQAELQGKIMYIRGTIINLATRALYESVPIDVMVRLVRELIPGYDIHQRTGIHPNIPIQPRDAAAQIMRDIISGYLFLPFVESLVQLNRSGVNGRRYPVPLLTDIAKELAKEGLHFDQVSGLFIETFSPAATANWRRLRPGTDSTLTVLRFDITQNTRLVRSYDSKKINTAFEDFRSMIGEAVLKRNGRLWYREGDGGLAAFYYGKRDMDATLAAMEVLHRLFIYNRLSNALGEPLQVRFAIHNGTCQWADTEEELLKNELVRRVKEIEARYTAPLSLTVSPTVYDAYERHFCSWFSPVKGEKSGALRAYSVRLEGLE